MRGATESYPMSYLMFVLYAVVIIVLAAVFLLYLFFGSFAHTKVERKFSPRTQTRGACVLGGHLEMTALV